MSIYYCRVPILLTMLVSGILAAPSEIGNSLLSKKNYGSRLNEVPDSPLERVQVKQESGFDGRVRSIRFSLEPEQDARRNERSQQRFASLNNFNFHPIRATYNQNIGLPMTPMIQIGAASPELPVIESISTTADKPSRSKREADKHLPNNDVDDLETAEAKVFRPLFVYRQQVSRRLRLQNDKQSNKNIRQIRPRVRSRPSRYYYSYQYPPAYTYFS